MPMSAVPPSPAMASTVISLSLPVARRPAASPAAAAAQPGKATLSQGTVTDEVRTAYGDVGAAQESLPLDTDALSIVVSDLAGQAITAALVDIEAQRALVAGAAAARPDTDGG